jgi:hypothetical protein
MKNGFLRSAALMAAALFAWVTPAVANGVSLPQYTSGPDLCRYDLQETRIACLKLEIEKHNWLRAHWLDFSPDVRAICASWQNSSYAILAVCLTGMAESDEKGELEDAKQEIRLRQQVEGK